ncbi:MAG: peptidase M22 [Eubacterium sp.]|nr:peptidase M22 [Eubacterium sp.]
MFAGFDTSNYTTSLAIFENEKIENKKIMLRVKSGERGLRQSDAVYQHTVNIPELISELDFSNLEAVGVSVRPRNTQGSYMPCFLVGRDNALALAKGAGVKIYETSHQVGHILAALYSCDKVDLIKREFIAFHLSGGTTEALLVKPDKNDIIKTEIVSESLDLKAGQAVDRTGVLLGMNFPCGKELDELSKISSADFRIKPTIINGNCSMSGVENKVKQMIERNKAKEDIAKFALSFISETVLSMLDIIIEKYGDLPIVFSGGVSSNSLLRKTVLNKYDAYFAEPEFSLDNAAGLALYAKLKSEEI